MNKTILGLIIFLLTADSLGAARDSEWFMRTPMQKSFNALMIKQPKVAWWELVSALNRHDIAVEHWLPLKETILKESNCGQILYNAFGNLNKGFKLSIISRQGFSNQGYQIKLSIDQKTINGSFQLLSPKKEVVLSGGIDEDASYQEWETDELLIKPIAGLYYLTFNGFETPIVVSNYHSERWLERITQFSDKISVSLPNLANGCDPATTGFHWFNEDYQQIGKKIIANVEGNTVKVSPAKIPHGAEFLSVSALIYELQSGVRVEYIHRISMPFALYVEDDN
ncbi:DUF2861 family protein [Agaribacter marinus]|uniref:DUF2861 domain-containing protein n=1 Tax=Agaribacter marinus TaxID=1431249 RepID=A0AA37WKY3_9ALTE|nr:DUF2861 family protein [Agaribacter marinus]GLR71944.1 hypothetical protein GCM10007852_28520 [Agaribacter marinus]